ncbi:hypothetical protein M405DRAFT_176082 [Rhizopogon salebrosus TDB-379]|nr:hypothetical protein M405DRAFT_176082 [Rhizopogon salebrosus TDB-379]
MEDVAVYCGCNWQEPIFCRYDSWLKRSRGHPLSLGLKHNESDLTDVTRSVLQQYRSQITSVTFLNAAALEILANDLPSLQTLTMKSYLDSQYDSGAFAQSISQLPSTLRSLRLIGGCIFDWEHLLSFNPVWTHLTNLEIALFGADIFLDLLQQGPNLSSATIVLSFSYVSVVQPFTHTKLQSLRLVYDSESKRPCQLLDLFNAPSFPDLRVLEAFHAEMQWPHEEFKAFLARSKCPLERLTLGAEMTTDKQKAEYVPLIPSLKILAAHVPHAHLRPSSCYIFTT